LRRFSIYKELPGAGAMVSNCLVIFIGIKFTKGQSGNVRVKLTNLYGILTI